MNISDENPKDELFVPCACPDCEDTDALLKIQQKELKQELTASLQRLGRAQALAWNALPIQERRRYLALVDAMSQKPVSITEVVARR